MLDRSQKNQPPPPPKELHEVPLVEGVVDFFANDQALSHIPVIGPSKQGAELEGSKEFAKAFMQRHNIPTAAYQSFTKDTLECLW